MRNNLGILLLSPYLPAGDTSACARKIYDSIRFLHQRGHRVYLLSFGSEEDKKRVDAIKPYCAELHTEYLKDYSRYPHNSINFTQKIHSLCNNKVVDILQCENSYLSRYIPVSINKPLVLVEHEILSTSFYERSKLENNLINKVILYARAIKKHLEEKSWYKRFSKIIVFSEHDKYIIRKLYNIERIEIIPLGINLQDYPLQSVKEKAYDLIFVGNFSHFPNTDAILHFYKRILPLIKNKLPDISIVVAGVNPSAAIKKLANLDTNISVTGYVKDILELYSKSKLFIGPIRYGTGMRYKILEALALRIPVVTTSIGARGIIFNGNIKIADTETEFADAVIDLLNSQDKCAVLAENGKRTVEEYYNWDILLDKYEKIYYSLRKA